MGASASSPKTARRSLFSRGEKKPPSPAPAPAAEDKGDRRGSFDSSMPSPSLQPKVPEFAKHHEAVCDRSPESPPRSLLIESREEATEKMLQLILCDRHESALFEQWDAFYESNVLLLETWKKELSSETEFVLNEFIPFVVR